MTTMASPDSVFAFLSASALRGCPVKPPLDLHAEEDVCCAAVGSLHLAEDKIRRTDEDSTDLNVPPLTSTANCSFDEESCAPRPQPRPIKSILKAVSAYGPAKNPKSLSRGFQSMVELSAQPLLPEDSSDSEPTTAQVPLNDADDSEGAHADRRISRSVSFSERREFRRVESLQDLESDKSDIWFQKRDLASFVQKEMSRRRKKGIECDTALCSEPYDDEEEEERQRLLAANMPKGVRR